MGSSVARIGGLLVLMASGWAGADEAAVLGLAIKTLGYDEALGARFPNNPIVVLMVGSDCTRFPSGVTLAGRAVACEVATPESFVGDAVKRGAMVLFTEDAGDVLRLAPKALEARLTVVSVTPNQRHSAVLVSTDESGKLFLGQQAIVMLGARFPASVLRLATIVPPAAPMPEPVPEDAEPPEPDAKNEAPRYPEEARARGLEGVVVLRVGVAADGHVSNVEAVKGESMFVQAAVSSVRGWRYAPAKVEGAPIAAAIIVKLPFRLSRSSSSFSQ